MYLFNDLTKLVYFSKLNPGCLLLQYFEWLPFLLQMVNLLLNLEPEIIKFMKLTNLAFMVLLLKLYMIFRMWVETYLLF